jgi:branched-chain amino acid transport system permease protein
MDRRRWLLWLLALSVLLLAALFARSYMLYTWSLAGVYIISAIGLNILTGYAGQISLGHAGLLAIGAYASALLVIKLGWPIAAALPAAGLVTGLVGLILLIPALRLTAIYFAIATLGFGAAVSQLLPNWSVLTGGHQGLRVPKMALTVAGSDVERYLLMAVATLVMIALAYNLARSHLGRAWLAMRDHEPAAQALGIFPPKLKAYAFVVSAFFTGIAGGLYAHLVGYISPGDFHLGISITLFAMIAVGGLATIPGAVLGAAFLALLPHWLSATRELSQILYGAALVGVVVFLPYGIWGQLLVWYYRLRFSDEAWAERARGLLARLQRTVRLLTTSLMPTSPAPAFISGNSAPEPLPTRRSGDRPLLELKDVTMQFGGLMALDSVSFTVREGEIVGLIGPNGAGKTTLFNLISRFYTPTSGRIVLEGEEITKIGPHQLIERGVVRTFQNIGLFPFMSVIDNLLVGEHRKFESGSLSVALGLPRTRREERLLRAQAERRLAEFGLVLIKDAYVWALPYGTKKLIELLRSLLAEPRLLLLDEPVAGMSQEEREKMARLIRRARDEWGVTVLLVEHDMSFVMGLCDRVVALSFGKVIAQGVPEEVAAHPAVIEAYLGEEVPVVGA